MRKYITIIGVGKRVSGTSEKTNRPYDFTPISFQYEDKFYQNGVKASNCNVNADAMGSYTPVVGDSVEVVMREDFKTSRVYIDAIL